MQRATRSGLCFREGVGEDKKATGYVAPSVTSGGEQTNPHFEAIGGQAAIAQLVERFYFHMEHQPEAAAVRALHPADLAPVREVLTRYLTEWMGGPQLYSAERGHPRLRKRHLPFTIGASERDAWMGCMRAALADVVTDPALRQELDDSFYKVADFIRNDADHQHIRH